MNVTNSERIGGRRRRKLWCDILKVKIIGQIIRFWFCRPTVTITKHIPSSLFQVPSFNNNHCFFGSVASEVRWKIHHDCPTESWRQLLIHHTPCAGARGTNQLIQVLFHLDICPIAIYWWHCSCSIKTSCVCSWKAFNCNKNKNDNIKIKVS